MPDLAQQFGPIDIYLFDQLLRGRISPDMRILDAGCGAGRNVIYFLREGYQVFGIDQDPYAIDSVRGIAATLAPNLPPTNFHTGAIEMMQYPNSFFDLVISNAVLHFAQDDKQFGSMLNDMWRVVRPGGFLFCRLASSIGIEQEIEPVAGRRFLLPDGSERYLVDAKLLTDLTQELKGELLDPIKTTVVQNQRSMTTWVLVKVN